MNSYNKLLRNLKYFVFMTVNETTHQTSFKTDFLNYIKLFYSIVIKKKN